MKLFLGVDGGQSTTTALIGDETGSLLGRGVGGPCNHAEMHEGSTKLRNAVSACLATACAEAGLDAGGIRFEAACFGMSGGPEDKQSILAAILPTQRLIVTTDAVIALAGATESGLGVITIAGTGSMAFGRNSTGATARAGGWGYIYGDEGSAFDIARQGLRAALKMDEGWGPATDLRRRFLEVTHCSDTIQMMHLFYTDEWPRSRMATLARLVDTAATEGDSVARAILTDAAAHLAGFAGCVRSRLWNPDESVNVAYIGGVFRSCFVRERFRCLVEGESGMRCGAPRYDPSVGALLEAYRAAGLNPVIRL